MISSAAINGQCTPLAAGRTFGYSVSLPLASSGSAQSLLPVVQSVISYLSTGEAICPVSKENAVTQASSTLTAANPTFVSHTASNTASPAESLSSGGLSTGAKIGIGIAVPACILIPLLSGLTFLWRYRRNRKLQDRPELAAEHLITTEPSELSTKQVPAELDPQNRLELEAQGKQELSAGEHSQELDA